MTFPMIAKAILEVLIKAQDSKKPIVLAIAKQRWGNGSTWEDLVDGGYIESRPDERGVLVTGKGRGWYAEH